MIKRIDKNITKIGLLMIVFSLIITVTYVPSSAKASASTTLLEQTEKIVNKKVKQTDSERKKLKKLFKFVEKNYDYKRTVDFVAYNGWEKDYASEMYSEKKGSCYHFVYNFFCLF